MTGARSALGPLGRLLTPALLARGSPLVVFLAAAGGSGSRGRCGPKDLQVLFLGSIDLCKDSSAFIRKCRPTSLRRNVSMCKFSFSHVPFLLLNIWPCCFTGAAAGSLASCSHEPLARLAFVFLAVCLPALAWLASAVLQTYGPKVSCRYNHDNLHS